MVTAGESQTRQQLSAWNSTDLNHNKLQLEQNCSLPYFIPPVLAASLAFQGQPNCCLLGLNTEQPSAVSGLFQVQHPRQHISYPLDIPSLKNCTQNGLGVLDKPSDASYARGKRFLIFDRSGNQTRLFVSPSPYLSSQNSIISPEVPATASILGEKVASGVDQQLLVKADVEEKWDENNLNDGEGEMLEDAEEINALLYSDSDDEYDDGTNDGTDSENDEISSMRHTLHSIEDCGNKGKSHEEVVEEVASSDGSPKRRKLLDGGYKKSSLVSVESPDSSCNHKDGVESHRGGARTSYSSKKANVDKALKILGSIIPNLNNKDPLSIIEKAIVYLETMKDEAKALGVS